MSKKNTRSAVIVAMREPFLSAVLNGEKTIEVRRTRPRRLPIMLFFYYRGKIYAGATLKHVHCLPCCYAIRENRVTVQAACKRFHGQACLTYEAMRDYLSLGTAPTLYELGAVEVYRNPVPVPCRPQSWQYMTDDMMKMIPQGDMLPRRKESV